MQWRHSYRESGNLTVGAHVGQDGIALDGLSGELLVAGALGDQARRDHEPTAASSSGRGYGHATPGCVYPATPEPGTTIEFDDRPLWQLFHSTGVEQAAEWDN